MGNVRAVIILSGGQHPAPENAGGGQAPDQAKSSNRAGAGDHERTSPFKGTKPVRSWVTLIITDPQPSSVTGLRGGSSQSAQDMNRSSSRGAFERSEHSR